MLGAGLGATLVGAFFGATSSGGHASVGLLVGPLIGTGIAAGLVAIFHRYAQRAWFLRTRPNRTAPPTVRALTSMVTPEPSRESAPHSARGAGPESERCSVLDVVAPSSADRSFVALERPEPQAPSESEPSAAMQGHAET